MPPEDLTDSTNKRDSADTSEKSSAHRSFFHELTNSALYSAVEQPALGLAQIFSNDAMVSVKNKFSSWGVDVPDSQHRSGSDWYAQTVGGALGMMAPFLLTKSTLGRLGAFGEAASAEGNVLSTRAAIGLSLKESAITGFTYGALFTPSDQRARDAGVLSFLGDRAASGVGSGLTFAALTAGSIGLGRLSETGLVTRLGLAPVLSNGLVSGTLSGLPGGFVGAEYDALLHHRRAATGAELGEAMLGMSVVGGTFGLASMFARPAPAIEGLRSGGVDARSGNGGTAAIGLGGFAEGLLPETRGTGTIDTRVLGDSQGRSGIVEKLAQGPDATGILKKANQGDATNSSGTNPPGDGTTSTGTPDATQLQGGSAVAGAPDNAGRSGNVAGDATQRNQRQGGSGLEGPRDNPSHDRNGEVAGGDMAPKVVPGEPIPQFINPYEYRQPGTFDQNARIELTGSEQDLLRSIRQAKSPEDWRVATEQIDELPSDRSNWFNETLDRQAKNLTKDELNTLWPELLQTDPHQGYRIAKVLGPQRMTEIWQDQLKSVQENGNKALEEQLARTTVFIEPGKQLDALGELLKLPQPPPYVDMLSATLAKDNQLAAAKMLADRQITPQIETSGVSPSVWTDWALGLEPGKLRDSVIDQIRRKIGGSTRNAAEELNEVYKTAQGRVPPNEYEKFNAMLTGINPKFGSADGVAIRSTALEGIDAQFIARMSFYEADWAKSDQIAAENPDLIRALAINSKFSASLSRSAYLSDLMSAKPPITAEQLTKSLLDTSNQGYEQGKSFYVSPGDMKALVEHGVKVSPEQVPALLKTLEAEVQSAFDMNGSQPVNRQRLLTALTLADSFGKSNPEAFQSAFREPIEATLEDSSVAYARRLEAAKALGELQRAGFEEARTIPMPELRMGKLVDLSPAEQRELRQFVEKALFSREGVQSLFGDGKLGRLLPSLFGDATEGGVVGRMQHGTHDFTLDNHLVEVVDRIGKDPDFARLMPKDQVDLLWAGLLHDIAKQENMVDHDHNRTSVSTAWGVLRSLGYSDARIQRITDLMSKDFDLSYDPDTKNSVRLADPRRLDDVVNSYRHADALRMVAILNRSDIKSVKADEAWWTPQVESELQQVQEMASARVAELNKHLLPILPSELPQGFGGYRMSDYSVFGHSSYDLGQLLKQRSTIESPEYSMSVSLFTPENHKVYSDGSQEIALINGPFEHIAQANRANLSTGTSIGWDGQLKLVDQWSRDHRAKDLAFEAEQQLAKIGIPAARNVPAENFPRLTQLRKILGQFENLDELRGAAGDSDPYVQGARSITQLLTHERDGSPLRTNNEIKLNNPIVSGLGLLRNGGQSIYFEGVSPSELQQIWRGPVPDFVGAGPAGSAPAGALVVKPDFVKAAKDNNLPIVILDGPSGGR
jgi:hypothetical protein